jgi:KipI family sensor histidine kinase inhibitor
MRILTDAVRILPAGPQGLVVEWPAVIDPLVNQQVVGLYRYLQQEPPCGWLEAIPSYRSLLVLFDPSRLERELLYQQILQALKQPEKDIAEKQRVIVLPTVYGGEFGPDLATVAAHTELTEEEVILLHTRGEYRVYMLGFTPGFPYLGGLDPRLATPRLSSPRTKIPAGSVGIASGQTGVYPIASPGGWQLIGRTPQTLFDPDRTPPTLLQPGDTVRFQAVVPDQFRNLLADQPQPVTQTADFSGEHICTVVRPGLLTTVQDLGRWGNQHLGVPTAGAMDQRSLRLANLLCGNDENSAALEITLDGPQLIFHRDTCLAVTGADLGPLLNERPLPMWTTVPVRAGSELKFSGRRRGCRAYLAIAGGLSVPLVMGSASTYLPGRLGGYLGRALLAGDRLYGFAAGLVHPGLTVPRALRPDELQECELPLVLGPQADLFQPKALTTIMTDKYSLTTQTDRMGTRLAGPTLEHLKGADIISDGIPPGAVQVPGHGLPIIMTADRQTTGGYPKIGVVTRIGLDRLAQRMPGDPIQFTECSLAAAEKEFCTEEKALAQWAESLKCDTRSRNWYLTVNDRCYHVILREKE